MERLGYECDLLQTLQAISTETDLFWADYETSLRSINKEGQS